MRHRQCACVACGTQIALHGSKAKNCHSDYEMFCAFDCLLATIRERGMQPALNTIPKPRMPAPTHENGYRSIYEMAVMFHLEKNNEIGIYEPFAIEMENEEIYVPDIFLPSYNVILEVKGLFYSRTKHKLTQLRKELPEKSFYLLPDYLCRGLLK